METQTKPLCQVRNGSYNCMRPEGHSGNKARHVSITISAGRPVRAIFETSHGKVWFRSQEV